MHLQGPPGRILKLAQAFLPAGDLHVIETGQDLPWRERPYRAEVQALGDAWLSRGNTLAARVPGALCPHEFNILLNPRHPGFGELRYGAVVEFPLDQRLLQPVGS